MSLKDTFCAHCGNAIQCRANNSILCECRNVRLSEETTRFLSSTRMSCLCSSCLHSYEKWVTSAKSEEFPIPGHELKEGFHYYVESGKWVFTEIYLIQRGYCCGNGCRHCPYGNKTILK